MTTAQKVILAVVLVILFGGGAVVLSSGVDHSGSPQAGASVNHYEAGVWQFGNGFYGGSTQQLTVDNSGNLTTSGVVTVGGTSGFVLQGTGGSCANSASSTIFAYLATATSSVSLPLMQVGGNATTSSLVIGTSTTPSPSSASAVSASLVNSSNGIASSTVQYVASGNKGVNGLGFINPGSGSLASILVKTGEYVVGYSTSTASGAGAVAYSPGFSTCTYDLEIRR